MKKYTLFLIALAGVFFVSCSSLRTISYDQLCPAQVSFPYQIGTVGIVNNTPSRPVPKDNILTLGHLEGEGKSATENLAGMIADSKYFNQVIICDSALQSKGETEPLTQLQVQELTSMLGVDMLISFERLLMDVQKKEYQQPGWGVSIPVIQVSLTPVVRFYVPERSQPLMTLSQTDTIYFDSSVRISEKSLMEEASHYASQVMSDKIVPYWEQAQRLYFDGGCVEMRDAGVYVREGNWTEARKLWISLYERLKKGNTKFKAAFNIALSYEMIGDMNNAEEWLKKSSNYVSPKSQEEDVLKFYISQFNERKSVYSKLNIQMKRFDGNS
ncbi:MAG: DUF6340 family protein [Phocaeicola sp.]|nr:DUF6340 family protein [Phocaeicola sp.]